MLSEMMTALASTTRTEDLAVRWGGEEWAEVETRSGSIPIDPPRRMSRQSRPQVPFRSSFLLAGVSVFAFVLSRRTLR
jgi:hypothetical protein